MFPISTPNTTGLQTSPPGNQFVRMQADLLTGILLCTLLIAMGCRPSAPDDLITEDQYIDILAELHLLAAMQEMSDDEQQFRKGREAVIEQYNITREQFEHSHNYYSRDVQAQQQRFREVRKRLELASSELLNYEHKMRTKQKADTVSNSVSNPVEH